MKRNIFILLIVASILIVFSILIFAETDKGIGKWSVFERIDPMNDTTIITFVLKADSGKSVYGKPIYLSIRKIYKEGDATVYRVYDKEGHQVNEITEPVLSEFDKKAGYTLEPRKKSERMEVWIDWGSYLGLGSYGSVNVLVRFDDEEVLKERGNLSNNHQATFLESSSWSGKDSKSNFLKFVIKLMSIDKFIVRVTPYEESPITAVFDVRGLKKAIEPYNDILHWIK